MKNLGYILLTIGFLAGAFFAVEQREGVPVAQYLTALVIGAIGVSGSSVENDHTVAMAGAAAAN